MKHILWSLVLLLLLTRHPASVSAAQSESYQQTLIGTKAKAWEVGHWLNSAPFRLDDLKGQVVLVRFWTAPSLNKLYENYHPRGLEVLGFYHHKAPSPLDPEVVETFTKMFGFRFPVAIDENWKTLHDW